MCVYVHNTQVKYYVIDDLGRGLYRPILMMVRGQIAVFKLHYLNTIYCR